MFRLFWISAIFQILGLPAFAQSKIDSLLIVLEKASIDSVRIDIFYELFDEYLYDTPAKAKELALEAIRLSESMNSDQLRAKSHNQYADFFYAQSNYDSAIIIYQKGLKISKKTNYNDGQSVALIGLGNSHLRKGNFEKALDYQERNIEFSTKINDKWGLASSYNNMGIIYNEMGEYTRAMEFYILSSQKYQEFGSLNDFAITLANIGVIQRVLENFESAKGYFIQSDSIFEKVGNQNGQAFVLTNLATIYKNTGELDRAKAYNLKALASYKKMGNRKGIAEVRYAIGNIHLKKGNIPEAIKSYQKSLDISEQINDSIFIAYSYCAIGMGYRQLNENKKAENSLLAAIRVATDIDLDLIAMDAYEALAAVYADEENFSKAYEFKTQYTILRDSLYTKEKRDLAGEIEAKYQNEQKAREIALLESKNDLQVLQIQKGENERNFLIAFAIIALFIIGLVYNQYRIKQKANAKLKALDQLKSDFFANISHEFRTPLSLIMAPLREEIEQPKNEKEKVKFEMMHRNADRLFNLINQLLDLSKLEDGKMKLEKSTIEISHFFKIITASFSSLAEYKKINFKIEIPDGDIYLAFDQVIIQKVSDNLLSNAFKFTPEGGNVDFKLDFDQNKLKIIVADSGSGIPMEDQGKVFDRFFQSADMKQQGTGIGLALTKELVQLHQGEIRLESIAGEGSTFTIEIPVQKIDASEKANVPIDSNTIPPNNLSGMDRDKTDVATNVPSILIIEDNPDLRNYLSELLRENYTIDSAENGADGIKKAKKIIPDLIISDVMMPEKDGIAVCNELKEATETNHIPIILLTARADQESKLQGLTNGADDYLLKPFDPKELRVRISNLLDQRRRLKEKYTRLLLLKPTEIVISNAEESFLKAVMVVVGKHMGDSAFGVELFCSEAGMSRMQLHRKLTALTGYSATAFVRHQRMIRASQLLEAGESVSRVAYAVGFESLSYFTRAFKEEFGIVPSEYLHTIA